LPFDELPTKEKWGGIGQREDAIGYNAKQHLAKIEKASEYRGAAIRRADVSFRDELAMVFLAGKWWWIIRCGSSAILMPGRCGFRRIRTMCRLHPARRIWARGDMRRGAMVIGQPTRLAPARGLDCRARVMSSCRDVPIGRIEGEFPLPNSPADALKTFQLSRVG